MFDTGKTDALGNKICFSVKENVNLESDQYTNVMFFNGQYKMYTTIFTASGTANETFVLDIQSDSDAKKYVANDFIDIYVEGADGTIDRNWNYDSNGIFLNRTNDINQLNIDNSFYGNETLMDKVYTVYLN